MAHAPLEISPQIPVQTPKALAVPRLSIVIVNYRQWNFTTRLVRQIRRTPAAKQGLIEIVVVDNRSPPHPIIGRMRRWPGVSVRRWGRNRGFARAANEGCRLSLGQWFLLLNPDVTLADDFLDGVLDLADRLQQSDSRAGIVGFKLCNTDGSPQLSTGPFPTLASTLLGQTRSRASRKYGPAPAPRRCRVSWVTGCCLLVRRDCFRDLRGFDPDFFLYYEDVDLCRRAARQQWSIWYEPKLRVQHHHPLHTRAVPSLLRLITRHSLLTYAAKHWPAWQFQLLAGLVQVEGWLRRRWAIWQGRSNAAARHAILQALAADLAGGRRQQARRTLARALCRANLRRQDSEGSAL